jgi:hypothetical protein
MIKDIIVPAFVGTNTIEFIVTRGFGVGDAVADIDDHLCGDVRVCAAIRGKLSVQPTLLGEVTVTRAAIKGKVEVFGGLLGEVELFPALSGVLTVDRCC